MLRKFVNILLAVFMLVATSGYTLSLHYCGDKHVSTSINHESKSCCNMAGCCHDESIKVKLEQDFLAPGVLAQDAPPLLDILFLVPAIINLDLPVHQEVRQLITSDSSPPTIQTKLSLLQTYLC